MMIKAGDWKRLTFLEKQDLLVHYAYRTDEGKKMLDQQVEDKKNKSSRKSS